MGYVGLPDLVPAPRPPDGHLSKHRRRAHITSHPREHESNTNKVQVQHSTPQCNTWWLLAHLVAVGRWDEAVEAARRRRAVALVVLHEGEVEPEPELVVEAPVQARDQLRVPRVAHLFDFEPPRHTYAGSALSKAQTAPITTPLKKQAESAGGWAAAVRTGMEETTRPAGSACASVPWARNRSRRGRRGCARRMEGAKAAP